MTAGKQKPLQVGYLHNNNNNTLSALLTCLSSIKRHVMLLSLYCYQQETHIVAVDEGHDFRGSFFFRRWQLYCRSARRLGPIESPDCLPGGKERERGSEREILFSLLRYFSSSRQPSLAVMSAVYIMAGIREPFQVATGYYTRV